MQFKVSQQTSWFTFPLVRRILSVVLWLVHSKLLLLCREPDGKVIGSAFRMFTNKIPMEESENSAATFALDV